MTVAVICGGVGAARLLTGLQRVIEPGEIVAIGNVGDDLELHGLHVSPDLDTIVYTTSGAVSTERGWGLEGETWQAMASLARYSPSPGSAAGDGGLEGAEGPTAALDWFSLGDRDLGTHLYRTHRLLQGAALGEVTAEIARAWGLGFHLLPVTDDRLRTMVTTADHGEISFQEYFVGHQHGVPVTAVRFDGAEVAKPGPGVLDALAQAERIVIAPSNPVVSIDPVLAVPGVRQAVAARRDDVVAVSPIVGGKALKGPADRLLTELGRDPSVVGVAEWYRDLIGTLFIDTVDAAEARRIEALGLRAVVTDTVMREPAITDALARALIGADS
ncbi:MAG: 2-phospho-L-lactate transferase [Actinomycetota bacterium]